MVNDEICTNEFIKKYLKTGFIVRLDADKTVSEYYQELCDDYKSDLVDKELVFNYIQKNFRPTSYDKIKYELFLTQTLYWKIISEYIKESRNECQMYAYHSKKRLEVHHTNYEILGKELINTDKLMLLCHDCHASAHKINTDNIENKMHVLEETVNEINTRKESFTPLNIEIIVDENDHSLTASRLRFKKVALLFDIMNHMIDSKQLKNNRNGKYLC